MHYIKLCKQKHGGMSGQLTQYADLHTNALKVVPTETQSAKDIITQYYEDRNSIAVLMDDVERICGIPGFSNVLIHTSNQENTMKEDIINTAVSNATVALNQSKVNPNPANAYQRVTYIYGRVAQQMSDAEIFKVIQGLEDQINGLKGITTESGKVKTQIAKLEKQLRLLVAYHDKRK